jgi:hypothetical protein
VDMLRRSLLHQEGWARLLELQRTEGREDGGREREKRGRVSRTRRRGQMKRESDGIFLYASGLEDLLYASGLEGLLYASGLSHRWAFHLPVYPVESSPRRFALCKCCFVHRSQGRS